MSIQVRKSVLAGEVAPGSKSICPHLELLTETSQKRTKKRDKKYLQKSKKRKIFMKKFIAKMESDIDESDTDIFKLQKEGQIESNTEEGTGSTSLQEGVTSKPKMSFEQKLELAREKLEAT